MEVAQMRFGIIAPLVQGTYTKHGLNVHAAIMALDRAIRHGGSTGSVYDERGILSF